MDRSSSPRFLNSLSQTPDVTRSNRSLSNPQTSGIPRSPRLLSNSSQVVDIPRSPRPVLNIQLLSSSPSKSGESLSDSFSLSPRIPSIEISGEHSINHLDNYKRELQIANQCHDPNEIQINAMDKRLDEALELNSNGKLDEARAIYSEIVDQCEQKLITNLKNPILREAVWGLQTNCSTSKSHDIMLAASSRPDRPAAQHQLGMRYFAESDINDVAACSLLINAVDQNYVAALNDLIDLTNKGSGQAKNCLVELVCQRPNLASQIIEKQLAIDIKDEFQKIEMKQAIADGEKGNKYAIDLIEKHADQHKLFALLFFTEQMFNEKECAINERLKNEVLQLIQFLKEGKSMGQTQHENQQSDCHIS